jgi:hypothetical protein
MKRYGRLSLLIAAGLMIALPAGWAAGGQPTASSKGAALTAPRSMPETPCGKRTDVVRMLHDNFGEGPIGQGLADSGAVAEVFLSAKGTWTIVATTPNGVSCMVGTGQSWQPVVARDDTF